MTFTNTQFGTNTQSGLASSHKLAKSGPLAEYITVRLADQLFGVPVSEVQDVFIPHSITRVPLSVPEIAGVLNLRGRIVTAIDMRKRLELKPREKGAGCMAVGVDYRGESYGLVIDSVGEVLRLPGDGLENNPKNLDPRWSELSVGVQKLEEQLLIVIDVERILSFSGQPKVA